MMTTRQAKPRFSSVGAKPLHPIRRRPSRLLASLLWLLPVAAPAEPLCPVPESCMAEARVISLTAAGPDLLVEMDVDSTLPGVHLGVVGRDGTVFETAWALVRPGQRTKATFSSVLPGTESRDIFYRVQAFDPSGHPLMDDFSFAVLFECHANVDCQYEVLPGIETDGMLVTRKLHDELSEMPPCDTYSNLQTIVQRGDDLKAAAQTLMHQLDRLEDLDGANGQGSAPAQGGCAYAWQTVIGVPIDDVQLSWSREDWTVGALSGIRNGGAQHYAFQATAHQLEEDEWSYQSMAESTLEVSILCLRGGPQCQGGCWGNVNLELESCQCTAAKAYVCQSGAAATAAAEHQLYIDINDVTIPVGALGSTAVAETITVDEAAADLSGEWLAGSSTPVSTAVWSVLDLHYSIHDDDPEPDASGAYVYAETEGSFELTADGRSACTANKNVYVSMNQPLAWPKDGGVLLRRWHPPDEDPSNNSILAEIPVPPWTRGVTTGDDPHGFRPPVKSETDDDVLKVACEDPHSPDSSPPSY